MHILQTHRHILQNTLLLVLLLSYCTVIYCIASSASPKVQLELAQKWNRTELFTNNAAYDLDTFNVCSPNLFLVRHSPTFLELLRCKYNSNDIDSCTEGMTYGTALLAKRSSRIKCRSFAGCSTKASTCATTSLAASWSNSTS